MENGVYSFALKTTLDEMHNLCPEITNVFIYKKEGEIVASDPQTPEDTLIHAMNALGEVFGKVNSLGDVEGISLEGTKRNISVFNVNDLRLVTVTTNKADLNYVNTVTRVLIPSVLKLLEKINPALNLAENDQNSIINEGDELQKEHGEEGETQDVAETSLPPNEESSANESFEDQFEIENISGLFVSKNTVRIDKEILSTWAETYGEEKIEDVEIVVFSGKTARCKVKPIEDSKLAGKRIVQMPEKMQQFLEIKKGELAKITPIIR